MTTNTSTLNDLIETLKDGQQGFSSAAAEVTSPDLKSLFAEYSQQRSRFAGELQAHARSVGESNPATTGSTSGAIHRGWINLKAALMSKDDHAVLAECERGEDIAVAAYKKAGEETDLPAYVLDTIHKQASEVKAAHDRVRNLRDSLAAK